ncbi:MAG: extracellular solute-binding protein [Deltaproteobacteria bacterium]|nr:extracellular solute-binding protein [Deltaproteobacteria bacterium]
MECIELSRKRVSGMRRVWFPVVFLFALTTLAPLPEDTLAQGQGMVDRVARAKKEGAVNFYSTWDIGRSQLLKEIFEKRYPGIVVNVFRATAASMNNRLSLEAKTGRHEFDVTIPGEIFWKGLNDQGLFAPYCSPERDAYPAGLKDDRCLWTMLNLNTNVMAYNTRMVSKEDAPRKLLDLLHPRWKDKLVMDPQDYRWFAYTLDKMGEEKGIDFMKRLAGQRPHFRPGHTLQIQLVAAGEFPVNVMGYGYRVEEMRAKGAPIDWYADEPVSITGAVGSLSRRAPHPEAGKLFMDFLLSREAQQAMVRFNVVPARPDVPPDPPRLTKGIKLHPVKPELADIINRRIEQFRAIFETQ